MDVTMFYQGGAGVPVGKWKRGEVVCGRGSVGTRAARHEAGGWERSAEAGARPRRALYECDEKGRSARADAVPLGSGYAC